MSCTSRQLRDACADEYLWDSLWEGPLPDGFDFGGKTAHAALWLLVKGRVEQVSRLNQRLIAVGGLFADVSTNVQSMKRRG